MAVYINRSQAIAERLVKLRDYLYTNATPIHAVKAADMLTYLASKGHEVETKTVYRDIETLRNFFGLEIDYDGRQKGYILKNPPFEPYELRMIVNSIQAAKFITQQEADKLADKVMRLADKYTRPSLVRRTLVHNRVRATNEEAMQGLDTIYKAIAEDRKISYKYFDYTTNKQVPKRYIKIDNSIVITASPQAVSWNGERFMILITSGTDEERPYALQLDRMEDIKIHADSREGTMVVKDIVRHLSERSKKTEFSFAQAKLKISNQYVSDVVEKLGDKKMMVPLNNDFFTAIIDEPISPATYIWTLGFDPRIEIIFPIDAEEKFRKYFSKISKGEDDIPPYTLTAD